MVEIDFLPAEYHQQYSRRHSKPWQIVAVWSCLGLVTILIIGQIIHRQFMECELVELAPAYDSAMTQNQRLADLRKQLQQLETECELITYMRHPWPRSRLLSALMSGLPEEITLQQLHIALEADISAGSADRKSPVSAQLTGDQQKTCTPAEWDLQTLQGQCDGKRTVIILTGSTTDSAAVPHFLNEILSDPLFLKAELGSVSSVGESSAKAIQFRAKLVVRPGYSQTRGPDGDQITSPLQNKIGKNYANY
jgi:hypothetical protein